ncbi:MAG: hypothetical protein QHJ73_09700 [Armatimonadota bacterium]|jgi:hypothetical protein|nr:hypothetical protein [Armatimonadota bacterium]
MVTGVAVGVFLAFAGRIAYHRVMGLRRQRRPAHRPESDHLGVFLGTVGVAIALWFLLSAFLGWQIPLLWRVAAILTGFLIADGLLGTARRQP